MERIVFFTLLVALTSAYPNGPPVSDGNLCETMFPTGHLNKEGEKPGVQKWTLPYEFTTSTNNACFKAGQTVEMMIETTNTSWYFEGYFAQVQKGDMNGTNFGTFEKFTNDNYTKPLDCFSKKGSAIGHADKAHFWSRKFKWTAPATGLMEDAYIRATIVKNQRTFWTDVKFPLKYDANCAAGSALKDAEIQPSEHDATTKNPDVNDSGARFIPAIFASVIVALLALLLQ